MSMYYCKKTRRQFLVGAGKTMLALPLLPSLLSETAQAQALTPPRRMMIFWFDHSNYQPLWPLRAVASTPVGSSGAQEVLLSSLGPISSTAYPLRHPLWQTIVNNNLLTMIRGFDSSVGGLAHGNGILAAAAGRNSEAAAGVKLPGHPTMDSLIENSDNVYPPLSTPSSVTRAMRIDLMALGGLFYQTIGNQLVPNPYFPYYGNNDSVVAFYNQVFGGLTGGTTNPADNTNHLKSNILNRVYDSYVSFKNNRKISSEDKLRLDTHMSFISQLQASLNAVLPPSNACSVPPVPTGGTTNSAATALYLQLSAMAFMCGLTKFGTTFFASQDNPAPEVFNFNEGFHGVIHGGAATDTYRADRQKTAFQIYWSFYADQMAQNYLTPLNVQEGSTGKTYLQNMLTGMLCMGGMTNYAGGDGGHGSNDSQQILIGDMGGAVRSGRYVALPYTTAGLPYNTLLITFLQLMGVQPSEYEPTSSDGRGFGNYVGFASDHPLRSRFYSPVSEILT